MAVVPSEVLTKGNQVYDRLRAMILSFEFRSGQALSERSLEPVVQSSRTAVKAAMVRLESEGLLIRAGRGYVVAPIEISVIEDAHDFLMGVEPQALRLAKAEGLDSRLDALDAILVGAESDASVDGFINAVADFHKGVAALTANAFFVRAVDDATTRLYRAAWLTAWLQREERLDWTLPRRVVQAMREGRREDAARSMVELLNYTKVRMTQLVREEQRGLAARGLAVA